MPSTKKLGYFKLTKLAAAYWRGDERRQQLQRVYGTAWESQAALDEYLKRVQEAERRDHRRLGAELDLFHFPPEIGPVWPCSTPKGASCARIMEDYSRCEHERGGYEFVYTPHLAKSTLFEISGHLGWYAEGMYPPMELEGATYYPKPMNCPMHILMYKSRQRSYRELPLRLFELGTVYRFERSGVFNGLLAGPRDDPGRRPHILHQGTTRAELVSLLAFVLKILRRFGLTEFEAELSTRPEKYLGTIEEWDRATDALRAALDACRPRVHDFRGRRGFLCAEDRRPRARRHRAPVAGVDDPGRFQLPQRFEMEYVGADNSRHRPYHGPPGIVRLCRTIFRHPHRALRRRFPHVDGPGPGTGARRARRPRGLRRPSWPASGRGLPGGDGRRPTSRSGHGCGGPSSRRSLTSWWSATTTWPPGPWASIPGGASGPSAACPWPISSAGSGRCQRRGGGVARAGLRPGSVRAGAKLRAGGRAGGRSRGRRRRAPSAQPFRSAIVTNLDHLWAGWRSEFVAGAYGGGAKDGGAGLRVLPILASGMPDEETHIVWRHPSGQALAIAQRLPLHERPSDGDAHAPRR